MIRASATAPEERLAGHERFRGYGIMTLPFDSGHVLGLRVMPENDFAPFIALWHRTPHGAWSMYVDGTHPETFCPRLFGPILADTGAAAIRVRWPDDRRLEIRARGPVHLDWSVELRSTILTRAMNLVLPRIPLAVYRSAPVLGAVRAVSRHVLGLGTMDLEGEVPGGQRVLVRPHRIHLVANSRAVLGERDLGRPTSVTENPTTGGFRWPSRGVLAEGDVHVAIGDPEGHRRRLALFGRAGA